MPEEILRDAGVAFTVHEHVPVATVAEIVIALPFPADEHVKTLAFDAGGRPVLASLRGSDRLHYGKLARAIGVARDCIEPMSPQRVHAELGLEPGGVSPLVDAEGAIVVVDARVLSLRRAFCGSGRNNATLELTATDLVVSSRAEVADLVRDEPRASRDADAPASGRAK